MTIATIQGSDKSNNDTAIVTLIEDNRVLVTWSDGTDVMFENRAEYEVWTRLNPYIASIQDETMTTTRSRLVATITLDTPRRARGKIYVQPFQPDPDIAVKYKIYVRTPKGIEDPEICIQDTMEDAIGAIEAAWGHGTWNLTFVD